MTDLIAKLNRAFCALFFSLALALSCIPVSAIAAPRAYADDVQEVTAEELAPASDEPQDGIEASATDQAQTTEKAQGTDLEPIAPAQEETTALGFVPQDENSQQSFSGTFDNGKGIWILQQTSEGYTLYIRNNDDNDSSRLTIEDFNAISGLRTLEVTKIVFTGSGTINLGTKTETTEKDDSDIFHDNYITVVTVSTEGFFANLNSLKRVEFSTVIDTSDVTNMRNMFGYCRNLTTIDFGQKFDTSSVTDMHGMFQGCESLTGLKLSGFNTSKVTDMGCMFQGCGTLRILDGLSSFDTSKVTDMKNMFKDCSTLAALDLLSFDTSSCENMESMFDNCSSLEKIQINPDIFNTSSCTNMSNMFYGCKKIEKLELGSFKTSNVANMSGMFQDCENLTGLDLSSFDTSSCTDMSNMFDFVQNNGAPTKFKSFIIGDKFSFAGNNITDANKQATLPNVQGWYSVATGKEITSIEDLLKEQKDNPGNMYFATPIDLATIQDYIVIEPVKEEYVYSPGVERNPVPTVSLKGFGKTDGFIEGRDFVLRYADNINAGTKAKVWIVGTGSFSGSTESTPTYFTIKAQPLDGSAVLVEGKGPRDQNSNIYELDDQAYTGKAVTPIKTMTFNGRTLTCDTDFTVSYSNNVNMGTATAIITAKGNYAGTIRAEFQIADPKVVNAVEIKAPTVSGTWKKSGSRWWFAYDAATKAAQKKDWPTSEWVTIGGKRYHFDAGGWMHTSWQKLDDSWFYFGSDGAMRTGWQKIGSKWYFMNRTNGIMQTGWFTDTNKQKYYLGASGDGAMKTGWQKISNVWYFFTSSGNMLYKWQRIGGKWYYLDASTGAMQTGLQKLGGTEYFFNSGGDMATGWKQIEKADKDGKSVKKWYYFDSSGAMAKSAWRLVGGKWYYMGADGAMLTGRQTIGNDIYFLTDSGAMKTGWNNEGTAKSPYWYYYGSSGARLKNQWIKSGGYWYHLSKSTGVMETNWYTDEKGNSYFLHDGRMIAGDHVSLDDGITGRKYYYFDSSGVMVKNKWVDNYYYGSDGVRLLNQWIGNYHVGADGKWDQTR